MAQPARVHEMVPYENMGPTLLAQQPPTISNDNEQKNAKNWPALYSHLETTFTALRNWRYSWWAHWSILAEFFLPRRYQWLVTANRMWKGAPINDSIIDASGLIAVRTCAAGIWTGLTSPSRPWMKIDVGAPWIEKDDEAKEWLEDSTRRVLEVFKSSNFYTSMAQGDQDVTVFGTSPIICYEDKQDIVRFYVPAAGEYYLAVGARYTVDVLNREFVMTIRQIVEMFDLENCPPDVVRLWGGGGAEQNTEMVVCHSIEPNFQIRGSGPNSKFWAVSSEFTWREAYWLKGKKEQAPLSLRGFREKPFAVFRWSEVSNDPYGRSPCMDALGDNKQVQRQTLREAEFIEKGVRPPMGADARLKNEPASINPGNVTYMTTEGGKGAFWPLFEVNPGWLAGLIANKEKVVQRIEKCLFVDLFMAISRMEGVQPRNELELTKRDLERLQELGPFVTLFEGEMSILIQRVFEIMLRRGVLKAMPRSLQGVPLKIDYTSILRLAQIAAEAIAMKDTMQVAGAMSSAAKAAGLPDPLRVINLDESMRHYAEMNNYPPHCIFSPQQVQQHDEAREKGMQQAQQPGQMQAAVDAAKNLSQASLAPGNALSALVGPQGGAPA